MPVLANQMDMPTPPAQNTFPETHICDMLNTNSKHFHFSPSFYKADMMKQLFCVGAVIVFILLILGLPACAGPSEEPGKQLQKQSPQSAGSSSTPAGNMGRDSAANHFPSRPIQGNKRWADIGRSAGTPRQKTAEGSSAGTWRTAPRAHPVGPSEVPSQRSARFFRTGPNGARPASSGQHSPLQIAQAPQSPPTEAPPAPSAPPAAAPPLAPEAPAAASGVAPSAEASDSLLPAEATRRTTNAAVVIAAVLSILAIIIAYLTRKPPAENGD